MTGKSDNPVSKTGHVGPNARPTLFTPSAAALMAKKLLRGIYLTDEEIQGTLEKFCSMV